MSLICLWSVGFQGSIFIHFQSDTCICFISLSTHSLVASNSCFSPVFTQGPSNPLRLTLEDTVRPQFSQSRESYCICIVCNLPRLGWNLSKPGYWLVLALSLTPRIRADDQDILQVAHYLISRIQRSWDKDGIHPIFIRDPTFT